MDNRLRNILAGAGIAVVGAVGTKVAVDYLRNRGEEKKVDESEGDRQPTSNQEVAYAVVEPSSVQAFLDKSFGRPGRYIPNRPPKVFEYLDKSYMVIWARDNEKNKNQMLVFLYTDDLGRDMIASVGYTSSVTDYNINLSNTPFVVELDGKQIKSGQGETKGTDDVDLVLAS